MNAESRKKTQEAVKKQVEKTEEKAHEHVKKIRESKIGKMVPTNFENITISEIVGFSFFFMLIINHFFFMFCELIAASEDPGKGKLFGTFFGYALILAFLANVVIDLYVYLAKKPMLLTFLLGKVVALVVMAATLFFKGGKLNIGLLKLTLALYFSIFYLFYVYFYSIFMSDLKMGALRADPSDHQAV